MSHRRLFKSTVAAFLLAILLLLSTAVAAWACTGLYLGKDTTEHATSIWGRSEDVSARFSKIFYVQPAETHALGSMFVSSTGFSWPYPAQTFRYASTPDSVYNEGETPQPFAEVGMNENGVAISGTVSITAARPQIRALDPTVRSSAGGLPEQDLVSVVLMQATSARHAVEVVAEIVDTVGSAEYNAFTVSDPDEIWYMEILSGHQYVAVKSAADKIAFSPNITMLGAVDVTDTENVIASSGLIDVAQAAGTLAVDTEGRILVAQSYTAPKTSIPGRIYLGYYYLLGVDAARALSPGYWEYFIEPRTGEKYSLYEAMRFLAYHGNQDDPLYGKYVANPSGNSNAIGNAGTVEAHVFETRDDMPGPLATVEWLTMGPAEFSIYLPYYANLITDTFENYYKYDSGWGAPDYNSMYWLFRDLYILCNANRSKVAPEVSALLELYQKELIGQQKSVDAVMAAIHACSPDLAQQQATGLSMTAAEQAFDVMTSVRNEILAYNADPDPDKDVFTPSALAAPVDTKYTFASVRSPGRVLYSGGNVTMSGRSKVTSPPIDGHPSAATFVNGKLTTSGSADLSGTVACVKAKGASVPPITAFMPDALVASLTQASQAAPKSGAVHNGLSYSGSRKVTVTAPITVKGNLTISGSGTYSFDSVYVTGNVTISGSAKVDFASLYVGGSLTVSGSSKTGWGPTYVAGNVSLSGSGQHNLRLIVIGGNLNMTGSQTVGGDGAGRHPMPATVLLVGQNKTLNCSGSVTFYGLLCNRYGSFSAAGSTTVHGSVTCGGSCTMSGTTSIIYDPNVLAALD